MSWVGDPLLLLEGSLGEAEDLGEGILTSRKTSLKCWRDSSPFQGRDSLAGWLGIRTKEGLLSLPSGLGLVDRAPHTPACMHAHVQSLLKWKQA